MYPIFTIHPSMDKRLGRFGYILDIGNKAAGMSEYLCHRILESFGKFEGVE